MVCSASGTEALAIVESCSPDLMLLDFQMPDMNGRAVLAAIRRVDGSMPFPVLMFTGGRTADVDEVLGLRDGAVDYIKKGVPRSVLLARIETALQRAPRRSHVLARGRLVIDLRTQRVRLGEEDIELKTRPFLLMAYLAEREGEVVTRDELLREIWGTAYPGFSHAVDQAVYEVRRALRDRAWIQTVPRRGYRFVRRA